ncbi:hypothetical protein [Tranquillimonas alkanivorans]|uniref:hypothetical protein n=1 Tax=Tranquillimonas alkanivorans TaxID=441119 RepID=UPI0011602872|nr:hypothetical protein [Tranquillimonas alkanivorans]
MASETSEVTAAWNQLIAAWRTRAIPVPYTTIGRECDGLGDSGRWTEKLSSQSDLRFVTDGTDIEARQRCASRECYFVRKYASCYFGTDLTVDAIQRRLRPMVVREADGDLWQAAHEQALSDIGAKFKDGGFKYAAERNMATTGSA